MSVNYILFNKDKVIKHYNNEACYSDVFMDKFNKDTTDIYLYQKYLNNSEEEVSLWVKELTLLGFPCSFLGKNENKKYHVLPEGMYIFHIPFKKYKYKNHIASLMTFLRYTFEEPYEEIVTYYLNLRTTFPRKNKFNLLQLSFNKCYAGGHTCHPNIGGSFLSKKQVFDKFKTSLNIFATDTSIHECWRSDKYINSNNHQNLKKDPLKFYKELNMNKYKIYVVGGDISYANWINNTVITKNLKDADIVMFTGGEDVHPSLYGEPMGINTYSNLDRDLYEKEIYLKALAAKKKMIGICRGSQFLCVMSGGKLVQHQENPTYIHYIKTNYGTFPITSTHHQAAYPYSIVNKYDFNVIGYTQNISPIHLDGEGLELNPSVECEIVRYYRTNCLGIQGHPEHLEFQREHPMSIEILNKIVFDFLN